MSNGRIAIPPKEGHGNGDGPFKELQRYVGAMNSSLPPTSKMMEQMRVNYSMRVVQSVSWTYWSLDRLDQLEGYTKFDQQFDQKCFPKQGDGATVYVIDTGCRETHADLRGRTSLRTTGDYISGADDNGHGTHVAGIAAGTTSGVCKKCTIVCIKALGASGGGSFTDVIEAIEDVIELHQSGKVTGPAVAVMSLGVSHPTTILDDAVTRLADSGVIPVVAASNYNQDACNYTPARADGAVAVGATDIIDHLYAFSNYGSCLNILAPGAAITSASFTGDSQFESRSGSTTPVRNNFKIPFLWQVAPPFRYLKD